MAYPHEPSTLNPFLAGGDSPATRDLVQLLMPHFFVTRPDGTREPSLAATEESSSQEEGSSNDFVRRVTLRDDALWSDGVPITAEDVRFTWQTIMNKRLPIIARDGYDRLTAVNAQDAKTVALFTRDPPSARLGNLFSAGLGVLPKHSLQGKPFANSLATSWPVSGGPFILKSWTRGLQMVFDRNPRAWGTPPALDRIRVEFVPDVVTAFQLFEHGDVDVLGPYPGIDQQRRGALLGGARVTSDLGGTWAGLFMNTKTPALSEVRVRKALAFSLDRAAIVQGLVRGEGEALQGLTDESATAFSVYRHDVAAAKRLLTDAGWVGSGVRRKGSRELSVTLALIGADELPERISRALHAQAEQTGFDLNTVALDADEFWRDWLRGSRFQVALVVLRDPPGGGLRAHFGSSEGENISKVSDASLDTLLNKADATPSAPEAGGVEQRLTQLVPAIPLYRARVTLIASRDALGVEANASADGFLWNAASWSRAG
ncbi:MAG: ABC transporter substrate-binding protein [Actinomycetota bacterium]|nr:ABC transporter substrate-binding protein [Actinomycetota bacterium]